MSINWEDASCKLTAHFTVKDCLWLNQWKRLATEEDGLTDEIKTNLLTVLTKMETIRSKVGGPLNVHSMYRPPRYSLLVGGSATDVHTLGKACDFDAGDISCDDVKQLLLASLDNLDMRLEDNGDGAGWVHVDVKTLLPGHNRFFKP